MRFYGESEMEMHSKAEVMKPKIHCEINMVINLKLKFQKILQAGANSESKLILTDSVW